MTDGQIVYELRSIVREILELKRELEREFRGLGTRDAKRDDRIAELDRRCEKLKAGMEGDEVK